MTTKIVRAKEITVTDKTSKDFIVYQIVDDKEGERMNAEQLIEIDGQWFILNPIKPPMTLEEVKLCLVLCKLNREELALIRMCLQDSELREKMNEVKRPMGSRL